MQRVYNHLRPGLTVEDLRNMTKAEAVAAIKNAREAKQGREREADEEYDRERVPLHDNVKAVKARILKARKVMEARRLLQAQAGRVGDLAADAGAGRSATAQERAKRAARGDSKEASGGHPRA
jgi:hypothetical protein